MDTKPLFSLSQKERKESLKRIVEGSAPRGEFYIMLVASTVLVTGGLLMNNAPIIIGGMLVAPILYPILRLSLGVIIADLQVLRHSFLTLLKDLAIIFIISFIISVLVIDKSLAQEIINRIYPNLAYLYIALAAGIAASVAVAKPNTPSIISGVAVSVALMPPLSTIAIAINLLNWTLVIQAAEVFALNLLGVMVAGMFVFSLMGFYNVRKDLKKECEGEGCKVVEK